MGVHMMTAHIKPTAPIITDAEIHEKYLTRAIDRWLDHIQMLWGEGEEALKNKAANVRSSRIGNVAGQKKYFNTVIETLGDVVIASYLRAQSRARMRVVWDEIKPCTYEGARMLLLARQHLYKDGPRRRAETRDEPILLLTRHSLLRLVQRADVSTVESLRDLIRESWPALAMAESVTRDERTRYPDRTWIIPASVNGDVVCFVVSGMDGDPGLPMLVKTVYSIDMVKDYQAAAVYAFSLCPSFRSRGDDNCHCCGSSSCGNDAPSRCPPRSNGTASFSD